VIDSPKKILLIDDDEHVLQTPAWLSRVMMRLRNEKEEGLPFFSLRKIKKKAVDQIEKEVISTVLDKTDWNRSNASKILKISEKRFLGKSK